MRVLAIVHERAAGPGVFAEAIAAGGHRLEEWFAPDGGAPPDGLDAYDAMLVLGGAMNIDEGERHGWLGGVGRVLEEALARETPLLGLCLGGQMMAGAAGATPGRAPVPEIGWHRVEVTAAGADDPLLGPLAPGFEAFGWHSYEFPLPPGATALARSEVCLQAARIGERAWALQFHPEVRAADAQTWIDSFGTDPDAVRIGIDPAQLGTETAAKIAAWNELGRELCERWLAVAAG